MVMSDHEFNGTQLDEVLEDFEFTADEVSPALRQALPPSVEAGLARDRFAVFDDLDGRRR
jgi:hypothetical protein